MAVALPVILTLEDAIELAQRKEIVSIEAAHKFLQRLRAQYMMPLNPYLPASVMYQEDTLWTLAYSPVVYGRQYAVFVHDDFGTDLRHIIIVCIEDTDMYPIPSRTHVGGGQSRAPVRLSFREPLNPYLPAAMMEQEDTLWTLVGETVMYGRQFAVFVYDDLGTNLRHVMIVCIEDTEMYPIPSSTLVEGGRTYF